MTTYFVCSGAGATAAPYDTWNKAAVSIPALMAGAAIAGTDIIYVHNTHAYNAGAAITWTLPESGVGLVTVICVDGGDAAFTSGGSGMGSTVGATTTGATESTNGNFGFNINNNGVGSSLYCFGMTIKTGSGGSQAAADILIGTSGSEFCFDACTFFRDSTNTASDFVLAAASAVNQSERMVFSNCLFRMGATGQIGVTIQSGHFEFWNCAIHASSSAPTTMFKGSATARAWVKMYACDWSAATNVLDQSTAGCQRWEFSNCRIATPVTGTHVGRAACVSEFRACAAVDGTNGADILSYYYEDAYGVIEDDQTVYLTTGSAAGPQDDGTSTPYSLKFTPSTLCSVYTPLYGPWMSVLVASTGAKTITVKAADTEAAVLKDTELFIETEYMGGGPVANCPQTEVLSSAPVVTSTIYRDVGAAGSNLTDTGAAWTGITETGTYDLTESCTLDEQGDVCVRAVLAKDTTNPVYIDYKIRVT